MRLALFRGFNYKDSAKDYFEDIKQRYLQKFDIESLPYWDIKELYVSSIKNRCDDLLLALIKSKKHKNLINVRLAVIEPSILNKKELVKNYYTPLSYAVKNNNPKQVEMLLKNGADPNKSVD
jgi:ankyrin repeat protein